LRSEKTKEKGMEELVLFQMQTMKKMFSNLDDKINGVTASI